MPGSRFAYQVHNPLVAVVGASVLLLCLGVAGLMAGAPTLSLGQLCHVLSGRQAGATNVLVWQSRLPRYVLGCLAGGLLGASGVLLQDTMRNALAGPELLGVSSGSAAVMAAIIVFQLPVSTTGQSWCALGGGVVGGGTVLAASWRDRSPERVVLIGVAVSALLNAVITTIVSLGQQDTITLFYDYLVGGLENRSWTQVLLVLPWLPVPIIAYALAHRINVMGLGDEVAVGLGLRVNGLRLCVCLLAIALVAPVVATCGPISYVALLAPHITRRLLGTGDARRVLPVTMLIASVLLCGADLLARTLFTPIEIPAGVWTTLLGGPFLLLVLNRRTHSRHA